MSIKTKNIILQIIFSLLVNDQFIAADNLAYLTNCPGGWTRINSGCYQFFDPTNWHTAEATCAGLDGSDGSVSHLLSLESETEIIGLQIWFKGNILDYDYWVNGFFKYNNATYYSTSHINIVWDWTGQMAKLYGYWDSSAVNYVIDQGLYLSYNGTVGAEYTGGHEYANSAMTASKRFICELSAPCFTTDNKCKHNGTCYVNSGLVFCKCLAGYVGSLCEVLIDNCDNVPCLHGGTCTNGVNNFTCACTEFYTGTTCNQETEFAALGRGRRTLICIVIAVLFILVSTLSLLDLPWNALISSSYNYFARYTEDKKKKKEQKPPGELEVVEEFQRIEERRARLSKLDDEVLFKLQNYLLNPKSKGFYANETWLISSGTSRIKLFEKQKAEIKQQKLTSPKAVREPTNVKAEKGFVRETSNLKLPSVTEKQPTDISKEPENASVERQPAEFKQNPEDTKNEESQKTVRALSYVKTGESF